MKKISYFLPPIIFLLGIFVAFTAHASWLDDFKNWINPINPPPQQITLGAATSTIVQTLQFFDELRPDGLLCSDGQILKKTGENNWDCAADGGGSGSGSFNATGTAGAILFFTGTNTGSSTASFSIATSTTLNADTLLFYGIASSTELRSPSGTIVTFRLTNASGENITASGYGDFGTLWLPNIANCTEALETSAGRVICGTDATGGGGTSPFDLNGTIITPTSTATLVDFVAAIASTSQLYVASGTVVGINFTNATGTNLNLTGLTATRLLQSSAGKNLQSVADLTLWIAGTASELTVADDGDGTVTLSLPTTVDLGASSRLVAVNNSTTNITASGYIQVTGNNLFDAGGNKYSTSTSGGGSVSTSSAISVNNFPFWVTAGGGLSGTSTLTINGTTLNSSGTLQINGSSVLTSSSISGTSPIVWTSGTGAISFSTTTLGTGGFTNDANFSTTTGANPTASVGLNAVNGTANTFMRSDGAPALSQTITPVWTGLHQFSTAGASTTQFWSASTTAGTLLFTSGTSSANLALSYSTASRCLRLDANKNVVAATGDCTAGDTTGGGGGVATSTPIFANALAFFTEGNSSGTIITSNLLSYVSSTGLFSAPTGTFSGRLTANLALLIATTTLPTNGLLHVATTTPIFTVLSNGRVGINSSTPGAAFVVESRGNTTTTVTIGGDALPGCIKMQDTDGAGWTYLTVLNGVLTASLGSCE